MREIRTEVVIAARAADVWTVLTDFARYPEWNPFLEQVTTELVVGAPVAMTVRLGRRALRLDARVTRLEPGRELRWAGPRSRWQAVVFRGDHSFRVEPTGSATCRFLHGEDFGGVSLPLLDGWMRRTIAPAYTAMNDALKRRAETLAREACGEKSSAR